jgi:hypothetical protein
VINLEARRAKAYPDDEQTSELLQISHRYCVYQLSPDSESDQRFFGRHPGYLAHLEAGEPTAYCSAGRGLVEGGLEITVPPFLQRLLKQLPPSEALGAVGPVDMDALVASIRDRPLPRTMPKVTTLGKRKATS